MANLVTSTEDLGNTGVWTQNDATVTANTHAAPAFAGGSAGMADTVADNSGVAQGNLTGTDYGISVDASAYVGSVFIRKDAVTTRWPEISLRLGGGTSITVYVNINTSTGAIADGVNPPVSSGVVNVDANWWRLWLRADNNSTNTVVRMTAFPDHLDALGGSSTSAGTGSVVLWGFNITNTSTVQSYEPEPAYASGVSWMPRTDVWVGPPVRFIPIR